MAVVNRDLPDGAREGHRQLAGRVVIAKQHVGNGVTAFGTGEPGFQNGVSLLIFFHQRQRAPVHQHQHQRLAGGFQGRDQIALALRDSDVGPAGGFVRHPLRFTHHRDHHVGLLRGVNRFVDHLFRRARIHLHRLFILIEEGHDVFIVGDVRTFGVNHFCVITHGALNAGQHGNGLIRHACGGPAAHDVALAVGQRTDHGNGAGFFQRQRVETVFQQHQAFASYFPGFFTVQTAFGVGVRRV